MDASPRPALAGGLREHRRHLWGDHQAAHTTSHRSLMASLFSGGFSILGYMLVDVFFQEIHIIFSDFPDLWWPELDSPRKSMQNRHAEA